jgi:uncharacterized protein (TIGR02246 family)
MRLALAATAAMICAAPTAFGQTPHDTATFQSIQNLCKAYDAAYNAKGPAGDAEFYAQDAVVVAADGAILQGRDTIIKTFGGGWKEGAKHVCKVDDAQAMGNNAWAIGETKVTGLESPIHIRWAAFNVKKGDSWEIKMLSVTPIIESKEAAK